MSSRKKKPVDPFTGGVPCPECGGHTQVTRTTVGERKRKSRRKRNFLMRERICARGHAFKTEEHAT